MAPPDSPASPCLLLFRNTGSENYCHRSADERQNLIAQ
jgi:hypothetical protein